MDRTAELMEMLVNVLKRETALLERLAAAQVIVRNAVFARDWTDLEALFGRLSAYSDEFDSLDRERIRLFDELRLSRPEAIGFYAMAARLPASERRTLTALYRRLKLDILKVRLANEALAQYLDDARGLLGDFLAAAFPDRKGKLYSRRGSAVSTEMSSLVLNRTF